MRRLLACLVTSLTGIAVIALTAGRAAAQAAAQAATIAPGMSEAQVVATLGKPLSRRSYAGFTYLFYRNGCEKRCGMNDLVTLDSGMVIDAVFRAPGRRYTGTSSSPRAIPAAEASKAKATAPLSVPAPSPSNPKKPPHVETGV
jgi:hypothetical protein